MGEGCGCADLPVEDEGDEELLDLGRRDVELLCDEGDAYAGVGRDHLEQHLGADVLEQVLDVVADEGIAHDRARVLLQQLLELTYLVPHICGAPEPPRQRTSAATRTSPAAGASVPLAQQR